MPVPKGLDKTIWTADNFDILRWLNSETVDIIDLDPPFRLGNKNYEVPVGSKAAELGVQGHIVVFHDLDVARMVLIAEEHPAVAYLLATHR